MILSLIPFARKLHYNTGNNYMGTMESFDSMQFARICIGLLKLLENFSNDCSND